MCTCGNVAAMERFEGQRSTFGLSVDPQIDWASRADGEEHSLLRGTHYHRDAHKVRRAAGMWASRNGLRAVTRTDDDGAEIVVCFVPKTGKV